MKHYLVTGGAGFIGSHLVESLLAAGNEVTVLDNLSSGKKSNVPAQATLVEGDICDVVLVAKLIKKAKGCFHLAAIPSVSLSLEQWAKTHRVNQGGSIIVFEEAARNNIPVVYASSAAVYGNNQKLPLKEEELTIPLSPYGMDKLACEWQAKIGARCLGLQSIGLRFFNVYGPRQDPKSPYSGVISIFIEKLRTHMPLAIYGDGMQSRDFIYVGDVVEHLLRAMQALQSSNSSHDIMNICSMKAVSIKDLARLLREISNTQGDIIHMPERIGDIRHSCGDNTKAKQILGVSAQISLWDGLKLTWQNMVSQP